MMSDRSVLPQWTYKYICFLYLHPVENHTFIVFPFPGIDGVWSLSHTLSILKEIFSKAIWAQLLEFFNYPYLFGLIMPRLRFSAFGLYQIFVVTTIYTISCCTSLPVFWALRFNFVYLPDHPYFCLHLFCQPELVTVIFVFFILLYLKHGFNPGNYFHFPLGLLVALTGLVNP